MITARTMMRMMRGMPITMKRAIDGSTPGIMEVPVHELDSNLIRVVIPEHVLVILNEIMRLLEV